MKVTHKIVTLGKSNKSSSKTACNLEWKIFSDINLSKNWDQVDCEKCLNILKLLRLKEAHDEQSI